MEQAVKIGSINPGAESPYTTNFLLHSTWSVSLQKIFNQLFTSVGIISAILLILEHLG